VINDTEKPLDDSQIDTILTDVFELYGYDFTQYAKASLKRRVNRLYRLDKFPSFAEFRYKVRHDAVYIHRFVEELTVNVTEMFRDPTFYQILLKRVFPVLATYPLIRIWHAGCATGEEAYSLAILLDEVKLLHKTLLYATDINTDVLESAQKGIFPLSAMKLYSQNYIASGGKNEFSSYYTTRYQYALMDERLRSRIIFASHNLVTDSSFNIFHLVLCRNVLIYFDKELQEKVFTLIDASLEPLGFLGLGAKETLRFSQLARNYTPVSEKEKLWRKQR
jgi:chemotaxis protein methyltransferase CheR